MIKRLLLAVMQTKLYAWLLLRVVPFIRFSTYYTSLRGWKYHRGYRLLRAGDIVLTTDRKKLTTLLIPGEFTHAAQCIDMFSEWEICEMTHENFTKSCFFDLCKEADRVVILRCRDFDHAYVKQLVEKCRSFQDAVYDLQFDLGVKALYCSELVYQSDFERRLQVSLEDLAGLGRPYISPTGLYHAKNVDVVWDSDKEIQ